MTTVGDAHGGPGPAATPYPRGSDFLQLDPGAAPPRDRVGWLADELRRAVQDGRLGLGSRLPATRILAAELGLARGTVVEAYRRLAETGVLDGDRGAGTRVVAVPPVVGSTAATPDPVIDVASGLPDLAAFPRAAWLRAEREVLATATATELGYAHPQGSPALRHELAAWLGRSRGIRTTAEQVVITAGVTGALSLLAQVLRERGVRSCAVEDPSAHGNRVILQAWLDRVVGVPVDENGLRVDDLAHSGEPVVLVTPAHQYPTGVVLSPARRRELVAWARADQRWVIEDDYDSEYRYDRAPVPALHPLAPDRVVHVSSLSKILAPALRLGWMVVPDELRAEIVHRRWATDLGSPVVPQLVLAQLLRSGALERHLRAMRVRHRRRRDAAIAAIGRHLPGCTVLGIAAGVHLLVRLPPGADDVALCAAAADRGVRVHPLSALRFVPGEPGLVLGYAAHPPRRVAEAVAVLGDLLPSS